MALANPQRNEIVIKLNGHDYLVRPTFNFIAEIEELFDAPLTEIVLTKLQSGRVKTREVAAIIEAGARAAGQTVDEEALQNDIAETGAIESINQVVPLLLRAFQGGEKIAKKK